MEKEIEIWKIYHKGSRVIWQVSNFGRVKRNGELYECKTNNCGYLTFGGYLLHRAVAELYVPNPENKPCVDHIDTNILNNHYSNLQWVTFSENNLNPITRKRISSWHKGRPLSENAKINLSNSIKGHFVSEETKQKQSKAMKGKFKGRHRVLGSDGKRHWV